jgi:hypothetical protein
MVEANRKRNRNVEKEKSNNNQQTTGPYRMRCRSQIQIISSKNSSGNTGFHGT